MGKSRRGNRAPSRKQAREQRKLEERALKDFNKSKRKSKVGGGEDVCQAGCFRGYTHNSAPCPSCGGSGSNESIYQPKDCRVDEEDAF